MTLAKPLAGGLPMGAVSAASEWLAAVSTGAITPPLSGADWWSAQPRWRWFPRIRSPRSWTMWSRRASLLMRRLEGLRTIIPTW